MLSQNFGGQLGGQFGGVRPFSGSPGGSPGGSVGPNRGSDGLRNTPQIQIGDDKIRIACIFFWSFHRDV